jgi:acetyl-CoA synthetase
MKEGRDFWLDDFMKSFSDFVTVIMDAEDPLFILYTSGSTGKPKECFIPAPDIWFTPLILSKMYSIIKKMIFTGVLQILAGLQDSYILYGPLLNGATTVIFEGVPTYPEPDRFWEVIEKHKVTQFYTAPTAIRSLAKESSEWVDKHDLSSLKVIGSVGEPINDEAWHWFNDHVGKKKCPIVDTWWQTETGGIMISPLPFVTPTKPTYATLPLPGIQPVLMDDKRNEITGNQVTGNLCIRFPWPGIARTIWGDHQRYKKPIFCFPGKYFTGDGALRDEVGYYRITGRVDDVSLFPDII